MSGYTKETGLWQFLPPEPAKWFWMRVKLYLAILAAVVAGFFFVAGWYAAPMEGHESRVSSLFDCLRSLVSLAVLVIAVLAARHEKRKLEIENHHPTGSGKPHHR
jgi:membrane protein implicated in regulation of membrane protease activity